MSSSSQRKIIDTTQASEPEDRSPTPEPELDHTHDDGAASDKPQASSSKSKKKKKSKAAQVLDAVRGKNEIPQELVSHVVDRVVAEHGPNTAVSDEDNIRQVLEQMKIMDVIKGKSGVSGRGKKAMGEHKVCTKYSGSGIDDEFDARHSSGKLSLSHSLVCTVFHISIPTLTQWRI
jgi:hypothetical protein